MYEKAVDKVKSFTALQEQEVSSCLRASVSPQTAPAILHETLRAIKSRTCLLILIQIRKVYCIFVECSERKEKK